jgi:adenylate cyclase
MYRLEIFDGVQSRHYSLRDGDTVVGRAEGCDLILDNKGVSRQHVRFTLEENRAFVTDLKSKNGIKINGVASLGAALNVGDRVEVGPYLVTLQHDLSDSVQLSDNHVELDGRVEKPVDEISKRLKLGTSAASFEDSQEESQATSGLGSNAQMLRTLNLAASALVGGPPVESVLQHVMDVVFEHIPAERGFLMLRDPANGQLFPAAVRFREARKQERVSISRTIAEKVMNSKVAILTADAATDGRFTTRQSIMLNSIRSCMVAPLWNRDDVMGVIHVDSARTGGVFDAKHLDLLCAMANYAAVALERARLFERAMQEEKKRERLSRYLSPQVTARVLADTEQTNTLAVPELRDVTILFADLVGFTSLAEVLGPQALAGLLNDYFTEMTEIIFRYDGTLDKYIGDAIMALFGAPLAMENHALAAVMAASEMRRRLKDFNARHADHAPLRMRIGINTGRVVAGEIGSPNKREYTVLGDTVNIASRLESSVAKPGMLVVGPATHDAVKDHFQCRALGALPLKGKAQQVHAFEVVEDE